MSKSNKKTLLLFVICLFLTPFIGYGQDILPKEQEREIKTSGKYYYSECSAFDVAEAKECALRDLTQIVLIEMVKEVIKSDEVTMKNSIEMRARTARLNLTGRIRILAWIEKNNVQMDTTAQTQAMTSTIDPAQTTTPVTASTTNQEQEMESTPVSTSISTQISTTQSKEEIVSEPEPAIKSDLSVIDNPVVRDLANCDTFEQFRRMADGFRRQGKIVYGTNKTAFINPENCLVAVFTPEQKLIALLDTGQNSRIDLLTGQTIQNLEQQFTGNILYWIHVNN